MLSGLSLAIVVIAILYAVIIAAQDTDYCYTRLTTLKEPENTDTDVNCFGVSRNGFITRLFKSTPQHDVRPGFAMPGLHDGHGHLLQYGEFLSGVNLFGAKSMEDTISRISAYLETHASAGSSEEWVRGVGWDQAAFDHRMPTAADLEKSFPGKFLLLDRVDVHCIWVSNAVLNLLQRPLPASPIGGEIITDPDLGVFCDNAMDLVLRHWPKPGEEQKRGYIKAAMQSLNQYGIVGMHDAGVRPGDLRLYQKLVDSKNWTLRVYAMLECDRRNTFCPEKSFKIDRSDGMLSVRSVKLFADGALGSWGSAMLEPYTDHPWTSGSLLVNASTLTELATSFAALGFQVNIHAIGDAANRLAVDAITAALRVNQMPHQNDTGNLKIRQSSRRHRIEHAQIIHPDDQMRIHALGILPSIQPTHATSDAAYAEDRLGPQRTSEEAYRMRSFLPLHPVLGSDFPVESPNPWEGMYAAITRKNPHLNNSADALAWHSEESLTLHQAIAGFTKAAARGAMWEGKAGVIQPGAFADWIVLDQSLDENMSLEDLRTLRVRETWVAGSKVYHRGDN